MFFRALCFSIALTIIGSSIFSNVSLANTSLENMPIVLEAECEDQFGTRTYTRQPDGNYQIRYAETGLVVDMSSEWYRRDNDPRPIFLLTEDADMDDPLFAGFRVLFLHFPEPITEGGSKELTNVDGVWGFFPGSYVDGLKCTVTLE